MLLHDSNSNPLQLHLDGWWVVIKKISILPLFEKELRTKLEGTGKII